jgi:hypothetical protein
MMADEKKAASAESLPFPPTPSASIAGRTMQESVYKRRVEPRRLPEDAPNRCFSPRTTASTSALP